MKQVIVVLVSLVLTSSVARARGFSLPEPNPMNGLIGVTVQYRYLFGLLLPASEVFFVKLEDGNEAFNATHLIRSSYRHRGQIYLLNAVPGRYVAVAAGLGSTTQEVPVWVELLSPDDTRIDNRVTTDRSTFFSMAMISETEVTVVPQEMVFMGKYLLSTPRKMKRADAAQAHYFQLLLPGEAQRGFMARQFSGQSASIASLKRVAKDTETERGFWTTARDKAFKKDPGWQVQVQRQLDLMEKGEPTAGNGLQKGDK
ncbi:MAG: hypothetical protein ACE5GX_18365 [Thermoanaerobaculia bacterium]